MIDICNLNFDSVNLSRAVRSIVSSCPMPLSGQSLFSPGSNYQDSWDNPSDSENSKYRKTIVFVFIFNTSMLHSSWSDFLYASCSCMLPSLLKMFFYSWREIMASWKRNFQLMVHNTTVMKIAFFVF